MRLQNACAPDFRPLVRAALLTGCRAGELLALRGRDFDPHSNVIPAATFHCLRHTYASHLAQQGVPLLFIAAALGHRDARMVEKHYGHLAPSHVAEAIRAALPSFGSELPSKVKRIGRRSGPT